MTKYYIAKFSDGTVTRRITNARDYTHAWVVRRRNNPEWIAKSGQETSQSHGFCGSERLAHNTLNRYSTGWNDRVLFAEIAPAIEVTAAEYKAAAK